MRAEELKAILQQLEKGSIDHTVAFQKLKDLPYSELGFAKIDHHREIRTGHPEVIFCQGKTKEQVAGIMMLMNEKEENILGTRAGEEVFEEVKKHIPHATYNKLGRTISIVNKEIQLSKSTIGIITAGTADIPVAEEAAETARMFGNNTHMIYDVGVAGIHRLFNKLEEIKKSKVLIVIAGMEGALPSVIGGLVSCPVIAVPTSIGYGANFGGLSALLGMLTSCANGITVVNIDNGYGAAYSASVINKL